ncbi:MAG: hypothetical protein AAGC55_19055 [Myxococcota bacterium]
MYHLVQTVLVIVAVAGSSGCSVSSSVSRDVGARCQSLDNCNGICLSGPEFPDGFCSLNCDDSSDCPDSVCADIDQGVCLLSCRDPGDCDFLGTGWTCATRPDRDGGEVNVCVGQ